MSETGTETNTGNVKLITYSFEENPPLTQDDRFITRIVGGLVGAIPGIFTAAEIDAPATHYEDLLNNAEGTDGIAAQRKAQYLQAHPVKHIPGGEFFGIVAGEIGLGAIVAVPLLTATRVAAFNRRMKRNKAIISRAKQWLDWDQQIRELKIPD